MSREYEEWAASLTIVGDEAYGPGERAPRPYRRLTDEERATYQRDWARRKRARTRPQRVGTLHDLSCTGPTRATGCRCRKITLYLRRSA